MQSGVSQLSMDLSGAWLDSGWIQKWAKREIQPWVQFLALPKGI